MWSAIRSSTFFRQSGWMVFATTLSGVLFYAVHFFAGRRMEQSEYGVFNALLQVLNQMAIPAVGLQMIFVQQAALTENEEHRRELAGAVRSLLKGTFLLWLGMVAVVWAFQGKLLADYKIRNPVALWATVGLGLVSMWMPVMSGILQGRQNFLWLGLVPVVSAGTRLVLVAVIVWLLAGQAAGAMVGVLLSMTAALAVGTWQTRALWRKPVARFYWTPWIKRVVPLTLGMGTATFMFTVDMLAVQRFLPDSGIYGAAGMIGRALVFLVAPLTLVMFPKVVRAAARSERTDVLAQALGATALLAAAAALGCTFLPELPIRIVQGEKYLAAAPLVRWFGWCVMPLMVSSVLVNNLMARERYAAVPWLVAVAALYAFTLWQPVGHIGPAKIRPAEILRVDTLAAKLRQPREPVAQYVQGQLSQATRQALTATDASGAQPQPVLGLLVEDLNRLIHGPSLYEPARFGHLELRPAIRGLLERQPRGAALAYCNRLLLEDAFPDELARTYRSHVRVIQTLGLFALAYFLVCLFFSLRKGPPRTVTGPPEELPLPAAG